MHNSIKPQRKLGAHPVRGNDVNYRIWAQGDFRRIVLCVILGLGLIGLGTWATFDDVFDRPVMHITGPQ